MDVVCVRPLDFADDHVLGRERSPDGGQQINCALMKAPIGSPLMEYCLQRSRSSRPLAAGLGQIGPRLVTRAVEAVAMPARILDPEAFYPIDYWQVWQLIRLREMPARLLRDSPLERAMAVGTAGSGRGL